MAPRKKKEEVKEEIEKVEEVKEEVKKEKPKKSIFRYFLGLFFIFIIIDLALELTTINLSSIVESYRFGGDILNELFYGLLVFVVMLLFKNSYVFTGRKEKFFKSVCFGAPMLFLSVIILAFNALELTDFDTVTVISCLVFCVLIGITEEFLCRGWILNEFLERYGESKKNVILSIIFSSLIFGIMHITNAIGGGQSLFETILQVINAAAVGFLFGSLYYKTKNIWSVAFLHAFYDFAIFIGEIESINNCVEGEVTNTVVLVECISLAALSVFWILSAILVLKKTHFPDENATRSNKIYYVIIPLLAISCIVALLPYDEFVEEYADYNVCYTYETAQLPDDYVLHIPSMSKYNIHISQTDNKILMDENENIYEVPSIDEYDINFELKNDVLTVSNKYTNTEKTLDNVLDFFVLEDKEGYRIAVVVNDTKDGYVAKYSEFIKKDEINNTDEYLEDIINSIQKVNIPEVDYIGYITIEDENYVFFYTDDRDQFIIKDGEALLLK